MSNRSHATNTAPVWTRGDYATEAKAILNKIVLVVPDGECIRVLFVGGGHGRFLPELASACSSIGRQLEVDFVEPITANIKTARKRMPNRSQLTIHWHHKTIEQFLTAEPRERYHLIVALLVFQYINYSWPSVLEGLHRVLRMHGAFLIDELRGATRKAHELLCAIDAQGPDKLPTNKNDIRAIKQWYLHRLHHEGVLWNPPLRATDMSLLRRALRRLFYEEWWSAENVGKRTIKFAKRHLPWDWGSIRGEEAKPKSRPPIKHNNIVVQERWTLYKKTSNALFESSVLDNLRSSSVHATARSLSALRLVEAKEQADFAQHHLVSRAFPRAMLSSLLNSGLFDISSTHTSCFLINSATQSLFDARKIDGILLFLKKDNPDDLSKMLIPWLAHLSFFSVCGIESIANLLVERNRALLLSLKEPSRAIRLSSPKKNVGNWERQSVEPLTGGGLPNLKKKNILRHVRNFINWDCVTLSGGDQRDPSPHAMQSISEVASAFNKEKLQALRRKIDEDAPNDSELKYVGPLLGILKHLFLFPVPGAWLLHEDNFSSEAFVLIGVSYDSLDKKAFGEVDRLTRHFSNLSQRFNDILFESRYETRFMHHAANQYLTSIFAQSLSHNIGSHALADPETLRPNGTVAGPDDIAELHQYLQGRLDYVAQLISESPQPEPLYLFGDVLEGFLTQGLLLNRLIADRGFAGKNLDLKFKAQNGCSYTLKWGNENDAKRWRYNVIGDEKKLTDDVLVGIPGGRVGRHALYTILENVMRNSAKYGLKRVRKTTSYELTISLVDPGNNEDYWILEIHDNVSGFNLNKRKEFRTFEKIGKDFDADLIETDGTPRSGGHGLVEIREAMKFLYRDDNPAFGSKQKVVNRVLGKDRRRSDRRGTLIYRVRLRRPRLLGVLHPSIEAPHPKEGVYFFKGPDVTSLAKHNHHLAVILDRPDDPKWIDTCCKAFAKLHWYLPFRLLVITKEETRQKAWTDKRNTYVRRIPRGQQSTEKKRSFLPKDRFHVISDLRLFNSLSNPAKYDLPLVNDVYDAWLRAYKPRKDGKKWHLVVCFQRDAKAVVNKWRCAPTFKFPSSEVTVWAKEASTDASPQKATFDMSSAIVFSNHEKPTWLSGVPAFSQIFGQASSLSTFQLLDSPPQDQDAFNFYVFNIVEAALTKIVIFDERVAGVLLHSSKPQIYTERYLYSYRAGISPVFALTGSARRRKPAPVRRDLGHLSMARLGFDKLTLYCPAKGGVLSPTQIRDEDLRSPDVVVLHEGNIEELVSNNSYSIGQEIGYFRRVSRICRTSGKGSPPRKLDSRLPFVEFSLVSSSIVPNSGNDSPLKLDKIQFAKGILNCVSNYDYRNPQAHS